MIDAAPDNSIINVGALTYAESVTIPKNLALIGVLSATSVIQPPAGMRGIYISPGHTVVLQNLSITSATPPNAVGGGVLIEAGGDLRVVNCRLAANSADYGGAIFADGLVNRVDIINSIIEHNTASQDGGGMYIKGVAALTGTLVLTNTAGRHGGGLHADSGRTELYGGLFAFNRANGGNGGAVNSNNSSRINGTQFISNTATQDGGGLLQWNSGQAVTVTNAYFEHNSARYNGGGLWIHGSLTVTSATFLSNTTNTGDSTDTHGGAIYLNGEGGAIISSTFTGNASQCSFCPFNTGGAVYLGGTLPVSVLGSRFAGNSGWSGAAIGTDSALTVTIQQSTFLTNSGGYGGALAVTNADIRNSSFVANRSVNAGGAIQAGLGPGNQSRITVSVARFISNTTGSTGGGAISTISRLDIDNSLFTGNLAFANGDVLLVDQIGRVNLRHVTIAHPGLGAGAAIRIITGTAALTNSIVVSYATGISIAAGSVGGQHNLFFAPQNWQSAGGAVSFSNSLTGADPLFVNPRLGDYHLRDVSSGYGAGINLGLTSDLDGWPRLYRFDLGALQTLARAYLPIVQR